MRGKNGHFNLLTRPLKDFSDRLLGIVYCKQGKYEEALETYRKALEINPNDETIHCILGMTCLNAGDRQSAIEHLKKALEINPNYILARESLKKLTLDGMESEEAENG